MSMMDAINDRLIDEMVLVKSVTWIKATAEIYRDWIGPSGRDLLIQIYQKMVYDLENEYLMKYGALPFGGYYFGPKASGY